MIRNALQLGVVLLALLIAAGTCVPQGIPCCPLEKCQTTQQPDCAVAAASVSTLTTSTTVPEQMAIAATMVAFLPIAAHQAPEPPPPPLHSPGPLYLRNSVLTI